MRKKLFSILLNHYFISVIVSVIIIYFLPDYFSKHNFELKESVYLQQNIKVYFPDLNNNGISEKVYSIISPKMKASFILYDEENNLMDQWSFSTNYQSALSNNFAFSDNDNNGFQEIYFVTKKADTAFLNCIEPISFKGLNKKGKLIFIDKIKEYDGNYGFSANGLLSSNHKVNGVNELYFNLIKGYGGSSRNTYKYNLKSNKITKSEHLTNVSMINSVDDINNDGFEEILFKNFSYDNKIDTIYTKRSDRSLWLNVLDHNLNFLFEPIEVKVPFSELTTIPYKMNGECRLISCLYSREKNISSSKLMVFSNKGKLLTEKVLPNNFHQLFFQPANDVFILFNTDSGQLNTLNFDLESIEQNNLEPNTELYEIDINGDGDKEWINITKNKSKLTLFDNEFKEEHSFSFPNFDTLKFFYGIKKTKSGNKLYIQNGDYYYVFNYSKNGYYYFKFLSYPLIYLLVLGFVFLILKGQKIRFEKQKAIEKEITELQLKTIKNQVDPHFVFNAINTISGLMLTDKKMEADTFICNFSDLMRSTLQQSDKVFYTLENEIKYVEVYFKLQKVRFKNRLSCTINCVETVNCSQKVPKHIIYTYVENAIKHGLNSEKELIINIVISETNKEVQISIEDNGGGFAKKTDRKISTGNGLKIMEQIYQLYQKLFNKVIKHHIEEVVNSLGKPTGIRVLINISK